MKKNSGFTLVEMAIVLAIIALVLGTGLTLLSAQDDQRKIEDTNTLLGNANEALIGYALSHTSTNDSRPYLPCPDLMPGFAPSGTNVANNGVEDRNAATGACDNQEGNLPWVTLGIAPATDAWSNRLRYRVTATFSNSINGMQLTFTPPSPSAGDINVYDAASGGNTVATAVPAIIISHGKNGLGAVNATGNANPAPAAANTDELANTNNDANFVSHSPAPSGAAGGYFDDQLVWLSQYTLFNRMVQAGKLP